MRLMRWEQGQHVTLIGPTGRGKTEALVRLLERRRYVIFLGTKKRDDTQRRLTGMGYVTVTDARQIEPDIHRRIILRPKFPADASAADLRAHHHRVFREGLMRAFRQENWTVAIDEARYITDFLGLTAEVNLLLLQGRSQGNSVVAGTQRPRHIPLEFYDQASHFLLWHDPDDGNTGRVRQMLGQHRHALAALERASFHDILYVNNVTGRAAFTNTRWE
jgi:hypothetical protein